MQTIKKLESLRADIKTLGSHLNRLESALSLCQEHCEDRELRPTLKLGAVAAYELCFIKSMDVIFAAVRLFEDRSLIDLEPEDVLRLALRYEVLMDVKKWFSCLRQSRAGYGDCDESMYDVILDLGHDFYKEARFLILELEEHHVS